MKWLLMLAVMFFAVAPGWADATPSVTPATPTFVNDSQDNAGQRALTLSSSLYCQTKSVLSGNLGLLVGLVLALMGLYRMVNGNVVDGLILLICGALLTALPSLVESFFRGVGSILSSQNGLGGRNFTPPSC